MHRQWLHLMHIIRVSLALGSNSRASWCKYTHDYNLVTHHCNEMCQVHVIKLSQQWLLYLSTRVTSCMCKFRVISILCLSEHTQYCSLTRLISLHCESKILKWLTCKSSIEHSVQSSKFSEIIQLVYLSWEKG